MKQAILQDGLMVHEVDGVCEKLQTVGIGFKVECVTAADAGIVDSHKNNWATELSNVVNYFNHGGTSVYMRVLVDEEELEHAKAALESKPQGKTDWMVVVLWVIIALAATLFAYSFVDPHPFNRPMSFYE